MAAPEASTDERASPPQPGAASPDGEWPEFATREEAMAFWNGVKRGICEAVGDDGGDGGGHPHAPDGFSKDLTRDGGAPSLTSDRLAEPWPIPGRGRADRRDGFTIAAEQLFLRTLADTGIVADACRAARISRQAAYARRRSASGRAFAVAWDAALLIARNAIVDDVVSRARHGVIERVYRDGELVAERHRYDNRLTMAVLSRLDRRAEGLGDNAPAIRAVAQEFDEFLERLSGGLSAAENFLAVRFPPPDESGEPRTVKEPEGVLGSPPPTGSEQALLARLAHFEDYGAGLPAGICIDDLDPEEMEGWTDEQFERAEASGFLEMLTEDEWPEAARRAGEDDADGECKMRQLYLIYHSPEIEPDDDDFAGCGMWESETGWLTDFPPPPGFDGYEKGVPGGDNYQRELAPEELRLVEQWEALGREDVETELAEMEAARRRFFGLDGDPTEAKEGGCDSTSPAMAALEGG